MMYITPQNLVVILYLSQTDAKLNNFTRSTQGESEGIAMIKPAFARRTGSDYD